jgi:hypothetical protein
MKNFVEVRNSFLDYKLVEFAFSLWIKEGKSFLFSLFKSTDLHAEKEIYKPTFIP